MDPQRLIPGDTTLIENIVNYLKAKGIFDEFRHECLADVDTKSSCQNLSQRVDGYTSKFLANETWHPDLNKNELRNKLRRNLDESGMLAVGADHVVEQVINPKVHHLFFPKIREVVHQYIKEQNELFNKKSETAFSDNISSTEKAVCDIHESKVKTPVADPIADILSFSYSKSKPTPTTSIHAKAENIQQKHADFPKVEKKKEEKPALAIEKNALETPTEGTNISAATETKTQIDKEKENVKSEKTEVLQEVFKKAVKEEVKTEKKKTEDTKAQISETVSAIEENKTNVSTPVKSSVTEKKDIDKNKQKIKSSNIQKSSNNSSEIKKPKKESSDKSTEKLVKSKPTKSSKESFSPTKSITSIKNISKEEKGESSKPKSDSGSSKTSESSAKKFSKSNNVKKDGSSKSKSHNEKTDKSKTSKSDQTIQYDSSSEKSDKSKISKSSDKGDQNIHYDSSSDKSDKSKISKSSDKSDQNIQYDSSSEKSDKSKISKSSDKSDQNIQYDSSSEKSDKSKVSKSSDKSDQNIQYDSSSEKSDKSKISKSSDKSDQNVNYDSSNSEKMSKNTHYSSSYDSSQGSDQEKSSSSSSKEERQKHFHKHAKKESEEHSDKKSKISTDKKRPNDGDESLSKKTKIEKSSKLENLKDTTVVEAGKINSRSNSLGSTSSVSSSSNASKDNLISNSDEASESPIKDKKKKEVKEKDSCHNPTKELPPPPPPPPSSGLCELTSSAEMSSVEDTQSSSASESSNSEEMSEESSSDSELESKDSIFDTLNESVLNSSTDSISAFYDIFLYSSSSSEFEGFKKSPEKKKKKKKRKKKGSILQNKHNSDVSVSSVHTSDLSSYDDELSDDDFSFVDESHLGDRKRLTLKKAQELIQNKALFLRRSKNSPTEHKSAVSEVSLNNRNMPKSTPFVSSDEESSPSEPKRSLRRERKLNPRYASSEYTSIFNCRKETFITKQSSPSVKSNNSYNSSPNSESKYGRKESLLEKGKSLKKTSVETKINAVHQDEVEQFQETKNNLQKSESCEAKESSDISDISSSEEMDLIMDKEVFQGSDKPTEKDHLKVHVKLKLQNNSKLNRNSYSLKRKRPVAESTPVKRPCSRSSVDSSNSEFVPNENKPFNNEKKNVIEDKLLRDSSLKGSDLTEGIKKDPFCKQRTNNNGDILGQKDIFPKNSHGKTISLTEKKTSETETSKELNAL